MQRYNKNELRAIHDFLVEQRAEAEEYIHEAIKKYEKKPDGMVRMRHQWATKIGDYLDWLCSGVDREIKDVK